jgi:hypothetical protein
VLCAAPMVATTPALHTVQDGSFSVLSGASSAEISRTIRDPTDRKTRSRRHVARSNSVVPRSVEAELSYLPGTTRGRRHGCTSGDVPCGSRASLVTRWRPPSARFARRARSTGMGHRATSSGAKRSDLFRPEAFPPKSVPASRRPSRSTNMQEKRSASSGRSLPRSSRSESSPGSDCPAIARAAIPEAGRNSA